MQRLTGLPAALERGDVGSIVGARYLRDLRAPGDAFGASDIGSGTARPIDVADVTDASAGRLLAGASHA